MYVRVSSIYTSACHPLSRFLSLSVGGEEGSGLGGGTRGNTLTRVSIFIAIRYVLDLRGYKICFAVVINDSFRICIYLHTVSEFSPAPATKYELGSC